MANVDELFAFGVMRATLGIDVEPFDDGRSPGMVDGRWRRPDGTLGPLEVRRCVEQGHAQLSALLDRLEGKLPTPNLRWWWLVRVSAAVDLRRLRRDLESTLLWCEGREVSDLRRLRRSAAAQLPPSCRSASTCTSASYEPGRCPTRRTRATSK